MQSGEQKMTMPQMQGKKNRILCLETWAWSAVLRNLPRSLKLSWLQQFPRPLAHEGCWQTHNREDANTAA